jgi:hypothetical protein
VTILPNILGCVEKMRYANHDVADRDKFHEFEPHVYMESKGISVIGILIMEPKQWIIGLYNTWIMNRLEIPHFGRGKDVNNCIKQLLELVHRGIPWLDRPVSIYFDLIVAITGLRTNGEKLEQYLDEKTKENTLEDKMKKTYGIVRGSRGIVINRISELVTRMETKILACKFLSKCHKEEAPTRVIVGAAQCVKGTLLN